MKELKRKRGKRKGGEKKGKEERKKERRGEKKETEKKKMEEKKSLTAGLEPTTFYSTAHCLPPHGMIAGTTHQLQISL